MYLHACAIIASSEQSYAQVRRTGCPKRVQASVIIECHIERLLQAEAAGSIWFHME